MPRAARQPYLSESFKPRDEHGGDIRKGKRKIYRPFDPKNPVHLVLRSEVAHGKLSMLGHSRPVQTLIHSVARRYRVRIFRYANAGNHLHLVILAPSRKAFQTFLRVLTGKIAQLMTGARKGSGFGKFWAKLAYTRVLKWGRDFRNACDYVRINEMEAQHVPSGRKFRSKPLGHEKP